MRLTKTTVDKERSQREPMQGEVKTGLPQQYHHKVGKDEPPEAAAIREDIKFRLIPKEYARSLTLFWYRGALFDIQHKGRGLNVRSVKGNDHEGI